MLLIYPRVAHLPEFELPHGDSGESHRRQRPFYGSQPSASITDYRPGDSLRKIHWPSTARRGHLMVKELDAEPSGDVWIILDLNKAVQQGSGATGTLEFGVIIAASLAAQLLGRGDRAVGLLAVSGTKPATSGSMFGASNTQPEQNKSGVVRADALATSDTQTLLIPPQPSQAQLWRILAALASVEPCDTPLATVLHNGREYLGNRGSVIVITPEMPAEENSNPLAGEAERRPDAEAVQKSNDDGALGPASAAEESSQSWMSELVRLQASGVDAGAMLIVHAPESDQSGYEQVASDLSYSGVRSTLAMAGIQSTVLRTGTELHPALTFRRTRQEVRSTPTGGAITVEIEEEVG